MQTHEANGRAIGDYAKAIRLALLELGMRRCSVSLVYRQAKAPVKSHRLDWYSAFWRWFKALWIAHRQGAEALYEDFCARVEALRLSEEKLDIDADEQLARCESENSDIIRARMRRDNTRRLIDETEQAIVEQRRYLAILMAIEERERARRGNRAA